MSITELQSPPEQARRDWLRTVDELLSQIQAWAAERGWQVRRDVKTIREKHLGEYATEQLEIETPYGHAGRLVVEPVAQSVPYADGRVDLYAWATRHRVWLLRQGEEWIVRTASGIDWPAPWSSETFIHLAEALVAAR